MSGEARIARNRSKNRKKGGDLPSGQLNNTKDKSSEKLDNSDLVLWKSPWLVVKYSTLEMGHYFLDWIRWLTVHKYMLAFMCLLVGTILIPSLSVNLTPWVHLTTTFNFLVNKHFLIFNNLYFHKTIVEIIYFFRINNSSSQLSWCAPSPLTIHWETLTVVWLVGRPRNIKLCRPRYRPAHLPLVPGPSHSCCDAGCVWMPEHWFPGAPLSRADHLSRCKDWCYYFFYSIQGNLPFSFIFKIKQFYLTKPSF